MDLNTHLESFYAAIENDDRISSTHISLYMAILKNWMDNQFANPITIKRDKIMKAAKISSRITYNHCMWALHDCDYIWYVPSFNYFLGSMVHIRELPEVVSKNKST